MKLTAYQLAILARYREDTAGIGLRRAEAKPLEAAGLVEWVGTVFGTPMYAITDAGRAALKDSAPSSNEALSPQKKDPTP
jgi:hypothetical protein